MRGPVAIGQNGGGIHCEERTTIKTKTILRVSKLCERGVFLRADAIKAWARHFDRFSER